MAAAELRLVFGDPAIDPGEEVTPGRLARPVPVTVGDIERLWRGRSQLLRFPAWGPVDALAEVVGQLSASTALFRHCGPTPELVEPVPIDEPLVYGSDLVTVQRYRGKTSERLTRAMLNIALAVAGTNPARPAGTVLDPMCGRGTTLNWALAYGLGAVGMDVDGASLDQHATFLETWAKRQRLPHKTTRFRSGNAERRSLTLEVAPDRRAFKAGDGQRVQTFRADAGDRKVAIKRGSVDVVVTDLPYGVQHRGSAEGRADQPADTLELLARSLPTWHRWLRPGGAVCLAWNTKRAGRREVGRTLADAGFTPQTAVGGFSMRHTVDATIDRDVIVARR